MGFTAIAAVAWKFVRPILIATVAIPLWLFPAAGVFLWWQHHSALNRAVTAATEKLVSRAELDAANAKLAEERRHRQAAVRALDSYRNDYAADMAAAEQDKDRLEQEITDNEKKLAATGRACLLDDADVDWLRKP